MSPDRPILIFIPTYNERENIRSIYSQIKKLELKCDFLFLDDNSPDGTGKVMDEIATSDASVHVIHRAGKLGIGSAHLDGIRWAYDQGYQRLVTMDCDFTHQPEDIPRFLEQSNAFDVVVGSRFMKKESLSDWNLLRKTLTHLGHWMTKYLLAMPYDATGAFRVYRLDQIPLRSFEKVSSKGYSFFFESLYGLHLNGLSIKEIPILLPARTYGHSKMTVKDSLVSLQHLFKLFARKFSGKNSLRLTKEERLAPSQDAQSDWDSYWTKKNKKRGRLYEAIAEFYRKNLIRRVLNDFLGSEFPSGSELLHAGCGSGQVDVDAVNMAKVTALDISPEALKLYKKSVGEGARILQGSVFSIPAKDSSFDGVYNLGVMEHFSDDEISKALSEFRRVLKPEGKVLLFWPPTFGLSVRFLDSAHFVLNRILRTSIKLHPDEISRIQSKDHARNLLERSGFTLSRYYFGPKDAFTHAILVGQKTNGAKP